MIFFLTYLRLAVKGRQNIPCEGGFILAGNHASYLDPVAFGVASPRHLSYMARGTLFRNRFFGWLLRKVSVFPLKRSSADPGAIKEALRRLKNGDGLLLFPEGTRIQSGTMAQGLAGAAFLARKSGVPVVPACIEGSDRAMPKKARVIAPFQVRVIFGEPIVFRQQEQISDQDFVNEIMRRIAALQSGCKGPISRC